MAEYKALNDEALEAATGGAAVCAVDDNPVWRRPHWQPEEYAMGTTFEAHGYLWYRIQPGDILGRIAQTFGTTCSQLLANNAATIKDVNKILYGDAIIIRRV